MPFSLPLGLTLNIPHLGQIKEPGQQSHLREFVENSRHPDPRRVRNGGPELRLVALIVGNRWLRWIKHSLDRQPGPAKRNDIIQL